MGIFTNITYKVTGLLWFSLALCCTAGAQTGNVVSLGTNTPAQWAPVDLGVFPTTNNVTILTGDTIAIDMNASSAKLTIDSGATLNSTVNAGDGNAFNLQAGINTTGSVDTLLNNGTFGSANGKNDGIILAVPATASNFKLLGTGITAIGGIGPAAANSNLTIDIAQDVSLNYKGLALSALPLNDSSATTDKIIFNIDTGKTATLINAGGQFNSTGTDGGQGSYTYNIYGTLNLSATTANSSVAPNYNGSITVNVGNLLTLGNYFNGEASSGPADQPAHQAVFNILNNALVDATKTQFLLFKYNYFTTIGSGGLKCKVGGSSIGFPVGAQGSSSGSPVSLGNNSATTNFTVTVKNQFDNPVPNSNKTVNKQWTITPETTGAANVTIAPMWDADDQAAGFNTAASIAVLNYTDNQWKETPADLSGKGTFISPYLAVAKGFNIFGAFVVANSANDIKAITKLKVWPNPAVSAINVSFPATKSAGFVKIASTNGTKMLTSPIGSGTTTWDANVSGLAAGIYILTVQDGVKNTSEKFIKL